MKLKYLLVLLVLGFLFTLVGAFFKLESLPYASELMLIGFSLKGIAVVLIIIKLLLNKSSKLLNS